MDGYLIFTLVVRIDGDRICLQTTGRKFFVKAYAIIPARAGSKGVPNKNIRDLAGHPLLAWSIAAATLARSIERVIVSTDSEKYAEIARQYGAEVPFLRPAELATDTSPDKAFLLHTALWLQKNDARPPDVFIHLRPTSPLRDPAILDKAIATFELAPQATSLRSAHEAPESPAKWFSLNADGYFSGFIGNQWLDAPRQACPRAYIPDGYVDIVRVSVLLKQQELYFPHMLAFIAPPCHEVDTEEDFSYLSYEVGMGHHLLAWLNQQE